MNIKNLREAYIYLWENLSGIQVGEKSKILRIIHFSVLILGSAWAVMNYLNSERLSELSQDAPAVSRRSRVDTSINQLIERINLVKHKREEGAILAGSMTAMNRRLFNTDSGYDINNMNGLNLAGNLDVNMPEIALPQQVEPPQVEVKAVMLSGKNSLAVINTPGNTALIVKRGSKLPGGLGQITAIKRDSVTLTYEKQNFVYPVDGIGTGISQAQAGNNNNSSRKSLRENMQSRYDIQDLYKTN